jgi:anti-anti-sigma factor
MLPTPSIQRRQHGTIEVLSLRGQFIGGKETDKLREVLAECAQSNTPVVVLDMADVTYLNSTALGVLIAAHSSISKRGGNIVLCGLSKSIENIFVITKLSLVFDIYRYLQTALDSLSSSTTE